MVDLKGQYLKIKDEVDAGIREVIDNSAFINGPAVQRFAEELSAYHGGCHVIPCGNGTDALQIALMALGLERGDEVIVPAFTYVASAEVIGLLGLTPVMVDVDFDTFNVTVDNIRRAYSPRTRAIIPVHLFGQCCDMEPILDFAREKGLYVIEDNAQAIGARYTFSDGRTCPSGTMGTIGCTSFFPSKNLGCYGDGGALLTWDKELAVRIKMIANHGQKVKYHHSVIGCNSRLDTIQAAVLRAKLPHLDEYCAAREAAAAYYDERLASIFGGGSAGGVGAAEAAVVAAGSAGGVGAAGTAGAAGPDILLPGRLGRSTHVFHQYTIKVLGESEGAAGAAGGSARDGAAGAAGGAVRDVAAGAAGAAGASGGDQGAAISRRDALKAFLASRGIPSMVYYPLPLQEQEAFREITRAGESLEIARRCAYSVLSLPIHTEITRADQDKVIAAIAEFFHK